MATPAVGSKFRYICVGGGNSAGYAIKELIDQQVPGSQILMLSAEGVLPYERPALSKAFLHPPTAKVRARLPGFHTCVGGGGERQTAEWYAEKGINTMLNTRVSKLFPDAHEVEVENGDKYSYENLIVATGCGAIQPKPLSGANVYVLRDEADAQKLVGAWESMAKKNLVIVGGGYIGFEVAAAAAGWKDQLASVTVVFPEENPLWRVWTNDGGFGSRMTEEFESRGVKVMKGEKVKEMQKDGSDNVTNVVLESGVVVPADIVVLGLGAVPNIGLLAEAGAKTAIGGIEVDGGFRVAGLSDVYTIGDIAAFPGPDGKPMRQEHVGNCRASAAHAVKSSLNKVQEPYAYTPYFYSRMFEYTDKPLVWNFWGTREGGEVHSVSGGKGVQAAFWVAEDQKIVGSCIFGSPPADQETADKVKGALGNDASAIEGIFPDGEVGCAKCVPF